MQDLGLSYIRLKLRSAIAKIILLSTCLLLLSFGLKAQKKKFSTSKSGNTYTIEEAKKLMEKNPEQAVIMLNDIISSNKRNPTVISEAYELLGDINVQNKLFAQAIDRYQKSLEFLVNRKDTNPRAKLYSKIGQSFLEISPSDGKQYFKMCMDKANEKDLYHRCYEGLADIYNSVDSLDLALEILIFLEEDFTYKKNPGLSRIQAKKADVLAQQFKTDLAIQSINLSQSNYSPETSGNANSIQKATSNIVLNQNSLSDEVKLRSSNIEAYGNNPDLVAEERLEIFDAYVKSGKTSEALVVINEVKPLIPELSEKIKANYFKKSSEIYTLQGDYKSAVENFGQYESARNKVLDEREKDLNNRLIINDLQSFVDISEKEYKNEQDRTAFNENIAKSKNRIIYLLIALLLGTLLAALLIFRNVQAKKMANKLLELRSLRSEMNPHFIFNALGSVNEYIATKDPRRANRFLADFSKLMRSAMEMNKKDLIPLQEELTFSELYLQLEHARWEDKFDFETQLDIADLESEIHIPPLLIQPYIENAIWHGLRYKSEKGTLLFSLNQKDHGIEIIIEDDGIGRSKSQELKTINQKMYASTGLKNTNKRADLINELYEKRLSILIEDAFPDRMDKGTRVTIKLS